MIFTTLVAGFVLVPFMVDRRLAATAVGRLRAVLRLRGAPVRVLGPRLGRPRARRHVHPLRRRARAVRLHPRARGDRRPAVAWIARRRPAWDAGPGLADLRRRGGRVRGRCARSPGRSLVHADWAGRQARFETVAAALDAAGAADTDRVMSIDASGTKYWTGLGRRRPRQRPARARSRRSPGPTTSAGSSSTADEAVAAGRADPRRPAAGLGRRAGHDRRADPVAARASTRSEPGARS